MDADQIDVKNLIETAVTNGDPALSEFHSKQLLQAYGVPVTSEKLTTSAETAVAAAEAIGYPVVMKACSPTLMHKSESGLITLNVKTADDVKAAYDDLATRAASAGDGALEGILVQEMISGKRELLIGMTRDPQFGPCVMLGLGGIMAEVLKDTAFRMAPVDAIEAADMADQLKSKKMLDDFRGDQAVDRDSLNQCLIAVGQIGMDLEAVAEIDINPLIITAKGKLTAVDALVVLKRS